MDHELWLKFEELERQHGYLASRLADIEKKIDKILELAGEEDVQDQDKEEPTGELAEPKRGPGRPRKIDKPVSGINPI